MGSEGLTKAQEIERDFADLLATGWPERQSRPRPTIGGLTMLLAGIQYGIAAQLIHSDVPATREFWRSTPIGIALIQNEGKP